MRGSFSPAPIPTAWPSKPEVAAAAKLWIVTSGDAAARTRVRPLLEACADALPLLASGEDERYQAEVLRLAPAPKLDPRARG